MLKNGKWQTLRQACTGTGLVPYLAVAALENDRKRAMANDFLAVVLVTPHDFHAAAAAVFRWLLATNQPPSCFPASFSVRFASPPRFSPVIDGWCWKIANLAVSPGELLCSAAISQRVCVSSLPTLGAHTPLIDLLIDQTARQQWCSIN